MEQVGNLGRENSQLQKQIASFKEVITSIEGLEEDLCWADSVVFSLVAKYCEEEIGLREFQKDLNKKCMSNLLVQALQQ